MKAHWLLAALVFAIFYLWHGGLFSRGGSSVERKAAGVRGVLWCISVVIVAWPLQLFRVQLGSGLYVTVALAILGAFYATGIFVTKALVKHHRASGQDSGASP